jgi:hypothetical protein
LLIATLFSRDQSSKQSINMAHIELPLHMIMKGVDKIPDSLWHKIPGLKPLTEEKLKEKEVKETSKEELQKHHHRRRSEGQDTKSRKQSTRRAQSTSPYASSSSEDEIDLDKAGRRSRRRHEKNYEDKYGGSNRRASAASNWNAHGSIADASVPLHVNTAPYTHAAYGHPAYQQGPAGATPYQYPPPPPHAVS